ncbi:hypothetical protein GCM10028797_10790 [Dyella agri]
MRLMRNMPLRHMARLSVIDPKRRSKGTYERTGVDMTSTDEVTVMYRPVGPEELELLRHAGFRRWPPRLPEQPIFYPVTNEQYAAEIAGKWNVRDSGFGAVTRFQVRTSFMSRYQIQRVGGAHHTEWWVPAEDLEDLNDNIVGLIEVTREFRS